MYRTPCVTWHTQKPLVKTIAPSRRRMNDEDAHTWRITKHNSYANIQYMVYVERINTTNTSRETPSLFDCARSRSQSVRQMCEHLPLEWGIIYYLHSPITLCERSLVLPTGGLINQIGGSTCAYAKWWATCMRWVLVIFGVYANCRENQLWTNNS